MFFLYIAFVLFVLNHVKYSFRWHKCSLHMYINHNFLPHFNTSLYMYLNSLSHVKFYIGCVYNLFDLPVCIKVFYTQQLSHLQKLIKNYDAKWIFLNIGLLYNLESLISPWLVTRFLIVMISHNFIRFVYLLLENY